MGGASYQYDGAGNRIQQTVGVDVTQYLLDLQPGLANVLQATHGSDVTRYLHAPRGIHAQQDASDNWTWMLQDGLGSVRSVVDSSLNPLESRLYEPYGTPFGTSGTVQTSYGFTGEITDANDLLYLRARYYAPNLGVFTGLDPFEGVAQRPMSLNRYGYAQGNTVNYSDPMGLFPKNESEIVEDAYQYSCNCGWLDWSHISEALPTSLLTRLSYAKSHASDFSGEYWGLDVGISVSGGGITIPLFKDIAAVQGVALRNQDITTLALSIFMDANEHFEETQGTGFFSYVDELIRGGFLKASSFSEEDLVSDFLGFYAANKRFFDSSTPPLKQFIRRKCDALNEADSREVFRYTYGGQHPAPWKNWYPRLPLLIDCAGNAPIDNSALGRCNKRGSWPHEFQDLVNKRIRPPQNPLERGIWFWLRTEYWVTEIVQSPEAVGLLRLIMPPE